jgi:hypothetical protein
MCQQKRDHLVKRKFQNDTVRVGGANFLVCAKPHHEGRFGPENVQLGAE